jgi:hypothetical protein
MIAADEEGSVRIVFTLLLKKEQDHPACLCSLFREADRADFSELRELTPSCLHVGMVF